MPQVGVKEINNQQLEIHASGSGFWSVHTKDGTKLGSGQTLDAAIANARAAMNKERVQVAIHFYTMDGKKGVATKIHGRTGKIMARVGGKSMQFDTYTPVFKGDTPENVIEYYKDLNVRVVTLRAEMTKLTREHTFNLGNEVRRAIDEASKHA